MRFKLFFVFVAFILTNNINAQQELIQINGREDFAEFLNRLSVEFSSISNLKQDSYETWDEFNARKKELYSNFIISHINNVYELNLELSPIDYRADLERLRLAPEKRNLTWGQWRVLTSSILTSNYPYYTFRGINILHADKDWDLNMKAYEVKFSGNLNEDYIAISPLSRDIAREYDVANQRGNLYAYFKIGPSTDEKEFFIDIFIATYFVNDNQIFSF